MVEIVKSAWSSALAVIAMTLFGQRQEFAEAATEAYIPKEETEKAIVPPHAADADLLLPEWKASDPEPDPVVARDLRNLGPNPLGGPFSLGRMR